ncbi:MAG: hypothetical protein J1G30_02145 [Spirochaetales bacterium]|nr:hypothetical protein [Spirochaetales bacterium]
MNRKYIGFYIVTGVLILSVLTLLVSKYYFDWFKSGMSKYALFTPQTESAKTESIAVLEDKILEDLEDKETAEVKNEETPIVKEEKAVPTAEKKTVAAAKKIIPATPLPHQKRHVNIEKTERNGERSNYAEKNNYTNEKAVHDTVDTEIKEFHIEMNQQNFHSLGEYVSAEELKYRSELIGKLTINTIVIDKLSKGNGISQEFFRVAYVEKMIPSKVLKDIVESKEFRDLIPQQYLDKEGKTATTLAQGEKVTFNAFAIKNLLELWSEGKLTPVQKAWLAGADGRSLD